MAQSKEALRALRKKYHLGEFRGAAKSIKRPRTSRSMARGRKSRSKKRSGFSSKLGVMAIILGVGGYIVFDAIVKPHLPISGILLSVAEIALGAWLSTSRKPFLKTLGIAAIVINVFALMKTYVTPQIPLFGLSTYL